MLAVRSVVDYFTNHGSNVNLCALNMFKACDKVNHYALYSEIMDRSIPSELLCVLISWYSISAACGRLDNMLYDMIALACGVKQGGFLSPVYSLLNNYVNDIIEKLSNE